MPCLIFQYFVSQKFILIQPADNLQASGQPLFCNFLPGFNFFLLFLSLLKLLF